MQKENSKDKSVGKGDFFMQILLINIFIVAAYVVIIFFYRTDSLARAVSYMFAVALHIALLIVTWLVFLIRKDKHASLVFLTAVIVGIIGFGACLFTLRFFS